MFRKTLRWFHPVAALVLFVGVFAAASATADCIEDKSATVEIAVASDATVNPDCVIVKKGSSVIVWSGNPETIKTVIIKFDRDANPDAPDDPDCTGAQCTLDKAKQKQKQGEFAYFVYVENLDGTNAGTDPVLIIKP